MCEKKGQNEIIGVAAVDENEKLANFSNYGSNCIDIAAPGTNFYSTMWHIDTNPAFSDQYGAGWSGSSVAAPLVAATLGIMKQVAPNLSVSQLYQALVSSTASIQKQNVNYKDLGAGMLDMSAAVKAAISLSHTKPLYTVLSPSKGFAPHLIVKDERGVIISEFDAYAPKFYGGVTAAIGDIDGDGVLDIVTVPQSQGGPHVRIFDLYGHLKGQFMAYATSFKGGLNLALGDLNGDAKDDIVVAPASSGPPEVRMFDSSGTLIGNFLAYAPTFNGGVTLAVGDLNADHSNEIITAPASAGGPHVRIFSPDGSVKEQFMAYDPTFRGGLTVAIGDVDADGINEIILAPITNANIQVKITDIQGSEKNRFLLYSRIGSIERPSHLVTADVTGDGKVDIVSFPLAQGAMMQVQDYYGQILKDMDLTYGNVKERTIKYTVAMGR